MIKSPLAGLMQDWPLTTDRIVDHAARWHGAREIVSRALDGSTARTNYANVRADAKRLSSALRAAGIGPGDRVATMAMNSAAHLVAWYAITGIGAVCHTLNPRLHIPQLAYIVNHAGDRLLLADGAFAEQVEGLCTTCPSLEQVIYLTGASTSADIALRQCDVADFVAGHSLECPWGGFDEQAAAGLCYTSGTTGNPKGVLYSHRSNFLHTLMTLQPDMFNIGVRDSILAVVPMYHANAWGLTFSAPAVGARLVLPGARVDGESLFDLIESERVTVAVGVPTVWLALLDFIEGGGHRPTTLERVIIGGAACPERLLRRFAALDIEPVHAWGMTEMSPVAGVGSLTPPVYELPFEKQISWRLKQGRSPLGVDLKIIDETGLILPHDGIAAGNLRVQGPAVASQYFQSDVVLLDDDGFFDTGDIATIDEEGFVRITDRAKDVIKSGGEWISSLDIESAVSLHAAVALAAVVGVPHPKWGERPRLYVQVAHGKAVSEIELIDFLRPRIARWWLPDDVLFVDEMPLGSTGKIDKRALRLLHEEMLETNLVA